MKPAEEMLLQRLVEVLIGAFRNDLCGAVLFGSKARGERKVCSDWDVSILADGIPENPFEG